MSSMMSTNPQTSPESPVRRCSTPKVLHRTAHRLLLAVAVVLATVLLPSIAPATAAAEHNPAESAPATTTSTSPTPQPLRGVTIALDPGHQLGNSNPKFRKFMAQKRFQGRKWKSCNTTGTATNSGYPESTFNWEVAQLLRAKLMALGADVPMTRTTNDRNHWGPCTWDRGTFGMRKKARLLLSIHADGAPRSGHGFHIITPALTKGWTDNIYREDRTLAEAMKRGMTSAGAKPSTYIKGAISVRGDMMSLNFSQVPSVLVELGNMRNPEDAARMTSAQGREQYARWLLAGLRNYLQK